MKTKTNNKIVYQIDTRDLQEVAEQTLDRSLTEKEIELVGRSVGDFINWFHAVDAAIKKLVKE